MAIAVTINAVDQTSKVSLASLSVTKRLVGRSTADCRVTSLDGTYSPQVGQSFEVFEGGVRKFWGRIITVERKLFHRSTVLEHSVSAVDLTILLDKRVIRTRAEFKGWPVNDIIRQLVSDWAGDESIDMSLVPAATGDIVDKIEFEYVPLADALNRLAESQQKEWWIDENRKLHFEDVASRSVSFTIDQAQGWNALANSIVLTEDLAQYANRVIGKLGKYQTEQQIEGFGSNHPDQPTNGSRTSWTMAYPLHSVPVVRVYRNGNWVEETVGVRDVDTLKKWYWQQGSAIIEQDDAEDALTIDEAVEFTYIGYETKYIERESSSQITARQAIEGYSGVYEQVIESDRVTSVEDAESYVDSILARLQPVPWKVRVTSDLVTPEPGDKFRLNLTGYGDRNYTVSDVTLFDRGDGTLRRTFTGYSGPIQMDGVEWFKLLAGKSVYGAAGSVETTEGTGGSTPLPQAPNPSTVTAYATYGADGKWGAVIGVNWPANYSAIKEAWIVLVGPTSVTPLIERPTLHVVPTTQGVQTYQTDNVWERPSSSQNFKAKVLVYNADGVLTDAPVESSTFSVTPISAAASSITSLTFTQTADDLGVKGYKVDVSYTRASDSDILYSYFILTDWDVTRTTQIGGGGTWGEDYVAGARTGTFTQPGFPSAAAYGVPCAFDLKFTLYHKMVNGTSVEVASSFVQVRENATASLKPEKFAGGTTASDISFSQAQMTVTGTGFVAAINRTDGVKVTNTGLGAEYYASLKSGYLETKYGTGAEVGYFRADTFRLGAPGGVRLQGSITASDAGVVVENATKFGSLTTTDGLKTWQVKVGAAGAEQTVIDQNRNVGSFSYPVPTLTTSTVVQYSGGLIRTMITPASVVLNTPGGVNSFECTAGASGGQIYCRDSSGVTKGSVDYTGLQVQNGGVIKVGATTVIDASTNWGGATIPVSKGGTGATDAAGARTNLGVASNKGYYTSDPRGSMSNGDSAYYWDGTYMWFVYKQGGNAFRVRLDLW